MGETWRRWSAQGKGDTKWTRGENSTFPSTYYVPGIYIYSSSKLQHLGTQILSPLCDYAHFADEEIKVPRG